MMRNRGFTLIETLIATLILLTGLASIATIFSFSARTDLYNEQRMIATTLLCEKIVQLQSIPIDDDAWTPGGGLNALSPPAGYFDFAGPYLRVWQISGNLPRKLTVAVFIRNTGLLRRPMELTRAATMASPRF